MGRNAGCLRLCQRAEFPLSLPKKQAVFPVFASFRPKNTAFRAFLLWKSFNSHLVSHFISVICKTRSEEKVNLSSKNVYSPSRRGKVRSLTSGTAYLDCARSGGNDLQTICWRRRLCFPERNQSQRGLQKESSRWLLLEEKATWPSCFPGTATLVPLQVYSSARIVSGSKRFSSSVAPASRNELVAAALPPATSVIT